MPCLLLSVPLQPYLLFLALLQPCVLFLSSPILPKANDAVQNLYSNEKSPLHHGFNSGHVPFIKAFLKTRNGSKTLESLTCIKHIF